MAIAFELVADFGDDKKSADDCCHWLSSRIAPVRIGPYVIAIHPPFVSGYPYEKPTQFQVSVVPAQIGYSVALDDTDERIPLTDPQLSLLGNALYDMLRGAPHYQLAMVGWDVEFLLDFDELSADWSAEISAGSFAGLVAKSSLTHRLPETAHFVPFDYDHVWIPYAGSRAI